MSLRITWKCGTPISGQAWGQDPNGGLVSWPWPPPPPTRALPSSQLQKTRSTQVSRNKDWVQ